MKTYVITTGVLFGLVTLTHLWRMIEERRALATSPSYIAMTILAAALALWAWRVVERSSPS